MGNYSAKESSSEHGEGGGDKSHGGHHNHNQSQNSGTPRAVSVRREAAEQERAMSHHDASGKHFQGYSSAAMGGEVDGEDYIPTVFKWDHGGKNVYVTGTFNNWERQIPMHKSGNEFSYVHNVARGKHAYKFIVDDEWRYSPDQPTIADVEGRINNFIDVSEFSAYIGDDHFFEKSKDQKVAESEYQQYFPDIDEYTKEPPALPPHLRHIILNKQSPTVDPLALPVPQHVSLNHLYCTAIKDGLMVLGSTQRYKEKFCTVVVYSVMPSPAGTS